MSEDRNIGKEQTKTPAKQSKNIQKATRRVFKGDQKIHHDLFKLLSEKVKKNLGYDIKNPDIRSYEHVHFFHSVDSKGRIQRFCNPSAGHIHEIEHDEIDGELIITKVGPPLLSISSKGKKKYLCDPDNLLNDGHVHKGLYLRSEEITVQKVSEEAAANMAIRANEERDVQRGFERANR